jgi:hypothetical protein
MAVQARTNPQCIDDAFDLYIKFNGGRFAQIEEEMRQKGWDKFNVSVLHNKGKGANYREGWITRFGWEDALKLRIATVGIAATTSAESLLFEVETIRKKIFMKLETGGVGPGAKDLIYQHDKYISRTTEILDKLEKARDNYANFVFFLQHLLKGATRISPALAEAICDAEEALIDWAEKEFVTESEKPEEEV